MQANPEHTQALDQLQSEINLILEQTGRFFASLSKPQGEQAARAARLKQQVASSDNRFHEALDVLDEQLQVAKAVMRRDLAVAREKEGEKPETKAAEPTVSKTSPISNGAAERPLPTETTTQPAKTEPVQTPISPEATPVKSPRKRPSTHGENVSSDEPAAKRQALGDGKTPSPKTQAGEPELQIDTSKQQPDRTDGQQPEEQVPDTGTFSNNADLDSLFNDHASAGGAGGTDSGEGTGFNTDDNGNVDFDFSTFNASLETNDGGNADDNADVSALLPGLQDYANNAENGEADLSSFFMNDPPNNGDENGGVQNGVPEPGRDDSNIFEDPMFNDFMDMDNMTFDMGGGDGNDQESGGHVFNFDE